MKKRILAVVLMLAMVGCFTACNQDGDKKEESSKQNESSVTSEGSTENSSDETSSEESYNMGDYIDQNIKNVASYKKMIEAGKGDVIIIKSNDYVSEYYRFADGEIGVVDKSTEKDNEYSYLKYTEGNKMYTVDVTEKMYAVSDMGEGDNSTDKENFLSDLTNYMYYGITYMGEKDGVEIYDVPQESAEDDNTESTSEKSVESDSESKTEESKSDSSTESSKESEASKETSATVNNMKRYIKVTDAGITMYDYLNGEKQSTIEITIRKIVDADKKQFTIEGCKEYEESSAADGVSYNEADLPDVPDLDASTESKNKETSSESKAS